MPDVGVALSDAGARHRRPADGVERREIEPEHVARSDGNELGRVKNDFVEAQLGRFDVGLSDQRVDGLEVAAVVVVEPRRRVRRRERRGGSGSGSPDLQEDVMLDRDDLGVDLPAGDDAVRQNGVDRVADDDRVTSGVSVRSQRYRRADTT